ncbi:MAG: hypothetical protein LBT99_00910 [Bifidobacteriaceae bacterium]|jgi:hypothetical protein|nr:hypothetical protein [Bifidobacteriaceae bacterium]
MEIRKNNVEIRKNWNKFSFKKLGIVFCLFLFGIVTFISGNLSQVNAASSSTVLPIAKGGTGSNSASGARTNLNAQETLVSGTNIRTVFGYSLLGTGNINGIAPSENSVAAGQTIRMWAGQDKDGKINESITTSYNSNNIVFIHDRTKYSFLKITSQTGVTSTTATNSDSSSSSSKTITVSVPRNSLVEGIISTPAGTFTIIGVNDNRYGFESFYERKK